MFIQIYSCLYILIHQGICERKRKSGESSGISEAETTTTARKRIEWLCRMDL